MLEEIAMDKKPLIRSGQGPSKGISSEAKKIPDGTNVKLFPKSGRKREPPNTNGARYEQNRKPVPQKSKALDKRPKPRGLEFIGCRKENWEITDKELESEFGFILESGRKKQSLNHLLNFHYGPRGENMPKRAQLSASSYSTKSLMATQAHKYNKEQFLQANCQFVVREGGDYSFNLGDPDLLVNWDLVELIVTSSCDRVICPICLYPPVAGKITRCGHVYCWSCILHYLALSDKTWRKCPICYESIHKKDLKSAECVEKALYSIGQNITMRLMKRQKGTLVATPVNQFSARSQKQILNYGDTEFDTVYSKLLTVSKEKILDLISIEYSELQSQVEELKGCPELCFVEQALELLAERRSLIESPGFTAIAVGKGHYNTGPSKDVSQDLTDKDLSSSPEDSNSEFNKSIDDFRRTNLRSESESASSEGDDVPNISAEDLEIKTSNQAQKNFYFYQAADGQHIYLHSLNVRMLEMTYGSLENCPVEISGKIVEKETGSMTPPLRKRLRYLEHVPITCEFEVTELDMKPPLITEEAFCFFQDQIEERRKRRQRQARAEKRREKKIEEAEMRQFNRRPAPNLRIESHFHFPEFGLDEPSRSLLSEIPESIVSGQSSRSESPNTGERNKSPFSSAVAALSLKDEDSSGGPSFAQIIREGKTLTSEAWPTIGSGVRASSRSSNSSNGEWVRRARQVSITQEESDDLDNDHSFSPPARPSFNIAEAIQLAASIERGENAGVRKKKKKQQKILFSTGGMPKGN